MTRDATVFLRVLTLFLRLYLSSYNLCSMAGDDVDDIDAQIAALQARKAKALAKAEIVARAEEKEAKKVLIGATPTKGRYSCVPRSSLEQKLIAAVKPIHKIEHSPPPRPPVFAPKAKNVKQVLPSIQSQAGPSRLSSSLAALRHKSENSRDRLSDAAITDGLSRSRDKRAASEELEVGPDRSGDKGKRVQRDDEDLTVRHDLRIGPKEHGRDPEGEDEWSFHEPNSGIRLS